VARGQGSEARDVRGAKLEVRSAGRIRGKGSESEELQRASGEEFTKRFAFSNSFWPLVPDL
jgi:hypothetical protein